MPVAFTNASHLADRSAGTPAETTQITSMSLSSRTLAITAALALAPAPWPLLFGLTFDVTSYGTEKGELERQGYLYDYTLEMLSMPLLAFVRLQPETTRFRPYIDLAGGMWMTAYNQQGQRYDTETTIEVNDDGLSIRSSDTSTTTTDTAMLGVTACYGVGAGIEWLLGEQGTPSTMGVGLDVRDLRGVGMPAPVATSAVLQEGQLEFTETEIIRAPSQILITLSLVVSSQNGSW